MFYQRFFFFYPQNPNLQDTPTQTGKTARVMRLRC